MTRTSLSLCALVVAGVASQATALDWPGLVESIEARWDEGDAVARAALLGELEGVEPGTMDALLRRALADSNVDVRIAAVDAASRLGAFAVESEIIAMLGDRAPTVRAAAATALGELRSPAALEPLVRSLSDPNAEVRAAAVEGLALLGSPDAVVAIVGVLSDSSRPVLLAGIEALGQLGQPSTAYALLERVRDPVEEVSKAAIESLVALRAIEAIPALIDLVEDRRPGVALAAIDGLATLGAVEGVPALVQQVLQQSIEGAADAALEALTEIGDSSAVAPLLAMIALEPARFADFVESCAVPARPLLADAYRGAEPSSTEASGLLESWLRSGDPAAFAALVALPESEISDVERERLIDFSPTAAAFCRSLELGGEADGDDEIATLAARAAASGAGECLVRWLGAAETLTSTDALAAATALAEAGDAAAVGLVLDHVDVERVESNAGAALAIALGGLGDAGAPALAAMLAADDVRVRREAAAALGAGADGWLTDATRSAIDAAVARSPEHVRAIAGLSATADAAWGDVLLERAAQSVDDDVRAEVWDVLIGRCDSPELIALARADLDGEWWTRRAAFRFVASCEGAPTPSPEAAADPVVRAISSQNADSSALVAIVGTPWRSATERVAALVELAGREFDGLTEILETASRDRDQAVAAAAWTLRANDEGLDTRELILRGMATDRVAERAALYAAAVLRADGTDLSAAIRRETNPALVRILEGARAYEAPTDVFVVEGVTGQPVVDIEVLVLRADGSVEVVRAGASGRVRLTGDDVIYAGVVWN